MASLYELDSRIQSFIDELYTSVDEDGCIPENINEQLEALTVERAKKLENIVLYIKNLTALADDIKQEEKNLKARRESIEKKAESLIKYVSDSMLKNGESAMESSRYKLSFRRSESVEIVDESLIPKKFKAKEIVFKIQKAEIKKALKSGIKVKGAELLEKQNLQIK